jgi:hypothetical protein
MSRLTDGDGRELLMIEPGLDDPGRRAVSLVQPGEKREFTLRFETRGTKDPRDVTPLWLRLRVEYDDRVYPADVQLVRVEPPRYYSSPYYYPYAYPYGYGGYGYGPYYGRPYYGPGFYGPYGSAGFGFRF